MHMKGAKDKLKKKAVRIYKSDKPLVVDRLTYIAAIIEPIITIPQAVLIFQTKSAAGISLLSWIGFQILTIIWIWYAIVHEERMILLYQGLFFIIQGFVIIGGIMYGAKWW